jgi:hypothetical protein
MEQKISKTDPVMPVMIIRKLFYTFLVGSLTLSISGGYYIIGVIIFVLALVPIFYLENHQIKNQNAYRTAEHHIKRDITSVRPKFIWWGIFLIGAAVLIALSLY